MIGDAGNAERRQSLRRRKVRSCFGKQRTVFRRSQNEAVRRTSGICAWPSGRAGWSAGIVLARFGWVRDRFRRRGTVDGKIDTMPVAREHAARRRLDTRRWCCLPSGLSCLRQSRRCWHGAAGRLTWLVELLNPHNRFAAGHDGAFFRDQPHDLAVVEICSAAPECIEQCFLNVVEIAPTRVGRVNVHIQQDCLAAAALGQPPGSGTRAREISAPGG